MQGLFCLRIHTSVVTSLKLVLLVCGWQLCFFVGVRDGEFFAQTGNLICVADSFKTVILLQIDIYPRITKKMLLLHKEFRQRSAIRPKRFQLLSECNIQFQRFGCLIGMCSNNCTKRMQYEDEG